MIAIKSVLLLFSMTFFKTITQIEPSHHQASIKTLSGKNFRVAAYHIPPFLISLKKSGSRVSIRGPNYVILTEAAKKFNFTITWNVSSDGTSGPGGLTPDGAPTGVMAEVFYNRSDLTATTAQVFYRSKFMDFTRSFQSNQLIFVTAIPQVVLSWGSIFSSYNFKLWTLILITFISFMIIYFFVLNRALEEEEKNRIEEALKNLENLKAHANLNSLRDDPVVVIEHNNHINNKLINQSYAHNLKNSSLLKLDTNRDITPKNTHSVKFKILDKNDTNLNNESVSHDTLAINAKDLKFSSKPSLIEIGFRSWFEPYGIALDQSLDKFPPKLTFLVGIWLLFVFFIGNGYKSNLVCFLSTPESSEVPRTFAQLSEMNDYEVVLHYLGGSAINFFTTTDNKVFRTIGNKLQQNPSALRPSAISCVEAAIVKKKTACIGWVSPITMAINTNLTRVSGVKVVLQSLDWAHSVSVAFGFAKGSNYTEPFGHILSMLTDMGLVSKWGSDTYDSFRLMGMKWLREGGNEKLSSLLKLTQENQEQTDAYFTFYNLLIVFVLHLALLFISSLAFAIEIMVGKKKVYEE